MVINKTQSIATILNQQNKEICFTVDDVKQADTLLRVELAKSSFQTQCTTPIVAFSYDEPLEVVAANGFHPLVHAVHLAFSQHRPLLLTPDIIWLTLAQGFAQHINNNAEALRNCFVKHQGKLTLEVQTFSLNKQKDWMDAIDNWMEKIFARVDPTLHKLLVCDFSTTTPITRTASQIVIMDTLKQYFDYKLYAVCGIPYITLKGTIDDWIDIKERVREMAKYDLNWWTKRLLPICNGFIETAKGKPPLEFWQSIYKLKEVYGGEVITGWLGYLFPYINDGMRKLPTVRNPFLEISRKELEVDMGLSPKVLPIGLSQVPITLTTLLDEYALKLVAGFVGVVQDSNTSQLNPEIGWGVVEEDKLSKLLAKLKKNHTRNLDENLKKEDNRMLLLSIPKEIIQLLEYFDGGILFADSEHPWYIRQMQDYYGEIGDTTHFIDLKDGRSIAYSFSYYNNDNNAPASVILGDLVKTKNRFQEDCYLLENKRKVARNITEFFEKILNANGNYYFDLPSFQSYENI